MSKSNDDKRLFLRDVSQISPLTAILFGAHLRLKKGTRCILELNDWLLFHVKGENNTAEVLIRYRKALDQLLSSTFLDLSSRRRRDQKRENGLDGDEEIEYFADEPLRAFFVDELVDLLDREAAEMNQHAAKKLDTVRRIVG